MRHFILALYLAAAGAPELFAAPLLSDGDRHQLQQSLNRGYLLYRYDQSAWHITDAALGALPESVKLLLRGYIRTSSEEGLKTTFFGEENGAHYALYSAVWTGSAVANARVYAPAQRAPLSAEETRLIFAREVALNNQTSLDMCSAAPPNVIVFPGSTDGIVHVYILTPQTDANTYPLGGHHRIDVRDGRVIAQRKFANSCLSMTSEARDGRLPKALGVTHRLDPVPTEIHVFNVFAIGLPLYVGVQGGRLYAVEVSGGNPRARLLEPTPEPGR